MSFAVPEFAVGNGAGFRVSASMVAGRDSAFTCQIGLALKARQAAQSVQPNDLTRWRRQWDDAAMLHFALRDCHYRIARGDSIAEAIDGEQKLTHAQRRFLTHALGMLTTLVEDASEVANVHYELADDDLRCEWPLGGGAKGEVTTFARHLRAADGSVHEAVRMRLKRLRPITDQDRDWHAVAALTLAYSYGVDPSARLRVSEFSLEDGELRCVFDGSRSEASALYTERGKPVRAAVDGAVFRAGSGCADCGFLNVCPAVTQRRGVLGIPGQAVATRSLTAADLHAYDRCPTAFAAQRRDHLPDAYPDGADIDASILARDRGLAVHEWLRWVHSRLPATGCTEADLPSPNDDATTALLNEIGLTTDGYRLAYPYLRQHLEQCPLSLDGLTGWVSERRIVRYDPDADIVVITTPDLIGEVDGTGDPIWRETKTARDVPPDLESAMLRYPAFALNIAVLAAESVAGRRAAHAELEILTPNSGRTFYVSLDDGAAVVRAQQIVAEIARRFAADLRFDRRPSGACYSCSAHRWCDPPLNAVAAAGPAPPTDDAEFGEYDDPF